MSLEKFCLQLCTHFTPRENFFLSEAECQPVIHFCSRLIVLNKSIYFLCSIHDTKQLLEKLLRQYGILFLRGRSLLPDGNRKSSLYVWDNTLLPPASEGWGRYCFHRCVSVHREGGEGHPCSLVPGPFLGERVAQSDPRIEVPLRQPGPGQGYPIPCPGPGQGYLPSWTGHATDKIWHGRYVSCFFTQDFLVSCTAGNRWSVWIFYILILFGEVLDVVSFFGTTLCTVHLEKLNIDTWIHKSSHLWMHTIL